MTEKKPIIRLLFAKIKEAFNNLSDEEKMEFMLKDRKNWEELGCKVLMMIDCRWSNEEWNYVGIEEWPTMQLWRRELNLSMKNLKNTDMLNQRLT